MLGICLGAQLIAAALGARVRPNPVKEIGWFPVSGTGAGDVFDFPPAFDAFHWHGETFDLPPGAELLATTEACRHQAFRIGGSVLALQFHLETTPDLARGLVAHCGEDLVPSESVQTGEVILAAGAERYGRANGLMEKVLGSLARAAGRGDGGSSR